MPAYTGESFEGLAEARAEGEEPEAAGLDLEEQYSAAESDAEFDAETDAESEAESDAEATTERFGQQSASEPESLTDGDQFVESDFETFPGPVPEAEDPPLDEVDAILESRRSLYKVALVGTGVRVTLPLSYEWTARYTRRALTEGAVGAAFNVIYTGGVKAAQIKQAYRKLVGNGVNLRPATKVMHGVGSIHTLNIEQGPKTKFAEALNLTPKLMSEKWRAQFGEAELIVFALIWIRRNLEDLLVPHVSEKALTASKTSLALIQFLLERRLLSMVEVAKRHPAAAPWRAAYKRNLALHRAERKPELAGFGKTSPDQWAKTALELSSATRKTLNEQLVRSREADRKHGRNEHLRPHQIKVDDPAKFILENFEPKRKVQVDTIVLIGGYSWIVHGGLRLSNLKQEPIFLLRVDDSHVVFQHLGDGKFYKQTLEGLGEELSYGVFVAAGQKAYGVIALTKWVFGLLAPNDKRACFSARAGGIP